MTAPPAGALEACLALLEKATPGEWEFRDYKPDGPLSDAVYTDASCEGGGDVVCVNPVRDGYENSSAYWAANAELIAAAVNFLRTHGPALLAALRLREGCMARVEAWRDVGKREFDNPDSEPINSRGRGRLLCADDLARILEQTK